jgi:esterase/lipase superfamily enzyme
MNLSPLASNAIIAALALLLYAFVWWATASLPRTVKVLARLVLALLALSPFLLMALGARIALFAPWQELTQAPPPMVAYRPVSPPAGAPPAEAPPAASGPSGPVTTPPSARREAEPPREQARRAVELAEPPKPQPLPRAAPPVAGAPPPAPMAAAPPPPPVAAAPPPAAVPPAPSAPTAPLGASAPAPSAGADGQPPAAANGAPAPSPRPAPGSAVPKAEAKKELGPFASDNEAWDIVPVFYGTDRQRAATPTPKPNRLEYGSDRGKRLELGQALVTIPKSHEVPQVERPWVYRLPFTSIELYREPEDPKRHFTMKELKALTRDEFIALVRKRLEDSQAYKDHALVFVHGFNTSFDNAVYRTAQIAYDLKFDGAPFAYSWPSKGNLGFQDYSYDRESAGQAEPYLSAFLELVARETGAKSISVIAHSMGNQLLLSVLRDLKRSTPPGVQISQVILAAPDVDRDNFEFLAKEIQGVSRGVTMFSAANDWALNASKQFWGGVPRAGDVPAEGPLIVPGVDTIDVTAINTELLSLNHSGYAEKTAILNDIQLLIQTGERPPEKRIPILQKVETAKGAYWRYPGVR